MSRERILLTLLVIVGITGAGSWLYNNFERVTERVRSGYSAEAKRNPFLAAERFLTEIEHKAASVTGREMLNNLPGSSDTLIINNFFTSLTDEKELALLEWVESGGHLIVTPTDDWDDETDTSGNHFFDELDIHRHSGNSSATNEIHARSATGSQQAELSPDLEIAFNKRLYLHAGENPVSASITSELQPEDETPRYHLVQIERGNGVITVLSDHKFLTNSEIGDYDHAMLLATLVGDTTGTTWLLYDRRMPSLWSLLQDKLPQLLFTSIAAILLTLWYLAQRSGPVRHPDETVRRNILEHLEARIHYLWRYGRHNATIETTQQQVLEQWLKHHYFLNTRTSEEQCSWIGRHMGLEQQQVQLALFETAGSSESLLEQAQILQLLKLRIRHPAGSTTRNS